MARSLPRQRRERQSIDRSKAFVEPCICIPAAVNSTWRSAQGLHESTTTVPVQSLFEMDVDYKYPEVDIVDTENWNVDYSKDKEEEEEEDK